MSRKSAEESSLELLLDTMCNTFGGVMFIAISLAVMISMRGAVESVTEDPAEKLAEMTGTLSRMQKEFAIKKKKTEELALAIKNMSKDPRLILVNEIAFLEQKLKEKLLEQKLKEQKRLLVQTQLNKYLAEKLKIANALKESREKYVLLVKELKVLKEEENKLKKRLTLLAPKKMVFNTLVEKKAAPYFIVVNDAMVWAVGPEISGTSYKPTADVNLEIKGSRYICHVVPGRGRKIFDGNMLSGEFQTLLQSIPSDRVPEFVISKSDAEVFAKLRAELKKQKIFHGFLVQKDDKEVFSYQFTSNSKGVYEY